jgi:hypothetical protein
MLGKYFKKVADGNVRLIGADLCQPATRMC